MFWPQFRYRIVAVERAGRIGEKAAGHQGVRILINLAIDGTYVRVAPKIRISRTLTTFSGECRIIIGRKCRGYQPELSFDDRDAQRVCDCQGPRGGQ